MTPLEQILEKTCKKGSDSPYPCEPSYLGESIAQWFKLSENEIILAHTHAAKYSQNGRGEKVNAIYSEYGTPGCYEKSCQAPLFIHHVIIMKRIPEHIFFDIRAASRYKWTQSEKEGKDIGIERAMAEWANSPMNPGFARQELEKRRNGDH